VSGPETGPGIGAEIRKYVVHEPDILSNEIDPGELSSFDPMLSVVGPDIGREIVELNFQHMSSIALLKYCTAHQRYHHRESWGAGQNQWHLQPAHRHALCHG
jgi:hypothetical protein